ncbi:MAG: hypothetical protein NUV85_01425 [Candidatus Berkelbacteria bacterium]|nr:hypothetical protein [Candidatus Berkelbacteria bacterium]
MIVIPESPKGKIDRLDDWQEWLEFSQTEFVLTYLWAEVEQCRILNAIESNDSCYGDPSCKGTRGYYAEQGVRIARQSFELIVTGRVKLETIHLCFDRTSEIREWWYEQLRTACQYTRLALEVELSSYEELFWWLLRGNYPNNLAGWAEHRGLLPGDFEAQLQPSYHHRTPPTY